MFIEKSVLWREKDGIVDNLFTSQKTNSQQSIQDITSLSTADTCKQQQQEVLGTLC